METVDQGYGRPDGRWRGPEPLPAPAGVRVLTCLQVAELAGVTKRTVTRWMSEGLLERYAYRPPGVNVRTTVVCLEDDVRRFLGLPDPEPLPGP